MPDRIINQFITVMYALAAISGGLGGCAVAGQYVLRGGTARLSYMLAYIIIGVMFGVLVLAYGATFGVESSSIDQVIGNSIIAGAAGSLSLASSNISARWVLKRLGIEVQVTVKRRGENNGG